METASDASDLPPTRSGASVPARGGMSGETLVERIESRDGTRLVAIIARGGGLFGFEELRLITQDGYTFWTPTHCSGLYDTPDAAERDARAILPWLRHPGSTRTGVQTESPGDAPGGVG